MIDWGSGHVVAICQETPILQRIDVQLDGTCETIPAIVYPGLTGRCEIGMEVILNQTARMLELGSGGFDFALPRSASLNGIKVSEIYNLKSRKYGHIMKLRYTPLQLKVHAIEETTHPLHDTIEGQESLQNCPVIVAELHSMLPVICSVIQYRLQRPCKIAYVMTDGGALPAMMSSNISALKQKKLLTGVVTIGHAFGGDLEAINLYSGLLAAKHTLQADIIVVAMGPGVVGSGTKFGHSGIEQGIALNAIHSLGGHGIPVLRCSEADARERHQGLSHHTITALMQVSLVSGSIGVPEIFSQAVKEKIWDQLKHYHILDRYKTIQTGPSIVGTAMQTNGLSCYSMGRKYTDDPVFFDMAGAAAEVALASLGFRNSCNDVAELRN